MSPELNRATLAACAVFYPGFASFSKRRREACISFVGKAVSAAAETARRETIEACAHIADANPSVTGATIAKLIRAIHTDDQNMSP
jgi:hypothetical protein